MARVLLFNFIREDRRKKVKAVLFRTGIPVREIPPQDQGRTLAELLDPEAVASPAEVPDKPFSEEMILMHGLTQVQFHSFLDGLKRGGISVPLKAVSTETNREWSARRLYEELSAEHRAMTQGEGKPAHRQG